MREINGITLASTEMVLPGDHRSQPSQRNYCNRLQKSSFDGMDV